MLRPVISIFEGVFAYSVRLVAAIHLPPCRRSLLSLVYSLPVILLKSSEVSLIIRSVNRAITLRNKLVTDPVVNIYDSLTFPII